MNGSIHNATHGDGGVAKRLSDHDVMLALVNGIDEMIKLVKPRKLVYLAVDGVAPRAKMNQQRSRRFRAGRDMAEAKEIARAQGEDVSGALNPCEQVTVVPHPLPTLPLPQTRLRLIPIASRPGRNS